MRKLVVLAVATAMVALVARVAIAHSLTSDLDVFNPTTYMGDINFKAWHQITSCIEDAGSKPGSGYNCYDSFPFQVHVGAQIKVGSLWGNVGEMQKFKKNYPSFKQVLGQYLITCNADMDQNTYTWRTRAKAGIYWHGGWGWTPMSYSGSTTYTCP